MRQFTLDEARETLKQVRPLVERMVALRARLRELEGDLAGWRSSLTANGKGRGAAGEQFERDRAEARGELASAVTGLEELGVLVKGIDEGLVDFPSIHHVSGEEIEFCWHIGEAEIGYWHRPEEGFAGRRPLPFS